MVLLLFAFPQYEKNREQQHELNEMGC